MGPAISMGHSWAMKFTALLGSRRKDGNTGILAEHLLVGAKDACHETEAISLRTLSMRPRVACERAGQTESGSF